MLAIGTKIRFNQDIINDEAGATFPFFAKAGDYGEVIHICKDGTPAVENSDGTCDVLFGVKPEWMEISG